LFEKQQKVKVVDPYLQLSPQLQLLPQLQDIFSETKICKAKNKFILVWLLLSSVELMSFNHAA